MAVKQVGAAPADPLDAASKGYADALVSFRVLVYTGGAYPARPSATVAPAGYVRYIGPTTPTDWLTGDEWVNNS